MDNSKDENSFNQKDNNRKREREEPKESSADSSPDFFQKKQKIEESDEKSANQNSPSQKSESSNGSNEDSQRNRLTQENNSIQLGDLILENNINNDKVDLSQIPSDEVLSRRCISCLSLCEEPSLPNFKLLLKVSSINVLRVVVENDYALCQEIPSDEELSRRCISCLSLCEELELT